MYIEGGDQYRGWFHSSLLVGIGLRDGAPYRECATSGWTLDGEGRALSKSQGAEAASGIINKHGAEVLRLWVASVEFHEDVRISDTILTRLSEAYRKLRNTFRYGLGNLYDFDPAADAVPGGEMLEIDQWILVRAEGLVERCRRHYEAFEFHRLYQALYNFATVDLSSLYFDILKDRLYTSAPESHARRSAQTAIYRLTHALVRLMAPLLTFTTEEVWSFLRKRASDPSSVHIALFPELAELTEGLTQKARDAAARWDQLAGVRETVLKSLEIARQERFIGANLEAKVVLQAGNGLRPLLRQYAADLPALFIVSQVELDGASEEVELSVDVKRADGTKCERCWKYTLDIGADSALPTVCQACSAAVRQGNW
jgi:isoleucyl-tRNA synthetase